MKQYKIILLSILIIISLNVISCDKRYPITMSDLNCNQSFGFETDRMISINIDGVSNSDIIIRTPAGYTLIQGSTDSIGVFNTQLLLANTDRHLIINNDLVPISNNSATYTVKGKSKAQASNFVHRHFPYQGGWSTIMVEDLWPKNGDYDMNDLIVDFYIKQTYNAKNKKIAQIELKYKIRAIGAKYKIGLAFMLPQDRIPVGLAHLSGASGQQVWIGNKKILRLFLDAKQSIGVSDNRYVNTEPSSQGVHVQPAEHSVILSFTNVTWSQEEQEDYNPKYRWMVAPYNPFVYISRFGQNLDNGRRVHLKNYPIQASDTNVDLFLTEDDRSTDYNNKNNLRTYQNSKGLPWAIYTNTSIPQYPIQKVPIIKVFPHFAAWVLSNGNTHQDWYNLDINMDLVY